MIRALRQSFGCGLLAMTLGFSCANGGIQKLNLPFGKSCLYAPIFVDQTTGQIAPELFETLNRRLYARAPSVFSYEYTEGCAVIDGTVLNLVEKDDEMMVRIEALLKDKDGHREALGSFSRTMAIKKTRAETIRALSAALAEDLLNAIADRQRAAL